MLPDAKPSGVPQRVLIVVAHPDDAEFMAGGSLAAWHRQGASIHYLLVTDGTGGSRDPGMTPAELARIRRDEQRNASRELGSDDITFLGYVDGRIVPSLELRLEIARVIRRVRPDTMVVQDPLFRYGPTYVNHPDHVAVADAALAAIMPVANTRLSALELLDEGLEPHDVQEIYLGFATDAKVFVSLTEADIERKAASLRHHHSQIGDWDVAKVVREWAVETAKQAREKGFDCEYAEGFAYVRLGNPPEDQPANVEPELPPEGQ